MDEKKQGYITTLQFHKWALSTEAGQIKTSKSQEDEKK
jgi:hypothetical protein